jgi:hypothetical protein
VAARESCLSRPAFSGFRELAARDGALRYQAGGLICAHASYDVHCARMALFHAASRGYTSLSAGYPEQGRRSHARSAWDKAFLTGGGNPHPHRGGSGHTMKRQAGTPLARWPRAGSEASHRRRWPDGGGAARRAGLSSACAHPAAWHDMERSIPPFRGEPGIWSCLWSCSWCCGSGRPISFPTCSRHLQSGGSDHKKRHAHLVGRIPGGTICSLVVDASARARRWRSGWAPRMEVAASPAQSIPLTLSSGSLPRWSCAYGFNAAHMGGVIRAVFPSTHPLFERSFSTDPRAPTSSFLART